MALALGTVRARLAAAIHPPIAIPHELGSIRLHPHQLEAAAAVLDRCRRFGGALLADPVGAGKTYTALACARGYAQVTVVAPAVLRPTWRQALARAGLHATLHSIESLARTAPPPAPRHSLVIVDEAHHARNPTTRRYRALARLAWGADVLLLTATPVHNSAQDLQAIVGLFAHGGGAAATWAVTLRRGMPEMPGIPTVGAVEWLDNPSALPVLDAILALPPPLPADDAGMAHALGMLGLVRQWLSSHAALARAIRQRLLAAHAMQALVERGEPPTREAIRRCVADDAAIQLSLGLGAPGRARPDSWHRTLAGWTEALNVVSSALRNVPDADRARASLLHTVLARNPGTAAVAFTHSAATARSMYTLLAPAHRSAGLWGAQGRVATGSVPRADILAQLGPGRTAETTPDPMRIDLLVSTDVLSEGVDLQAAGIVIHLDLPWTPARLEQRVGRLRRPGSPHASVAQYAFGLSPAAHRYLGIIRRLCDKARTSREVAGIELATTALHRPTPTTRSATERMMAATRTWATQRKEGTELAIASVRVHGPGDRMVAALRQGEITVLLCDDGSGLSTDPDRVASVLEQADGPLVAPKGGSVGLVTRRVRRWCRDHEVLTGASPRCSPVQRAVLRRLNRQASDVPRHERELVLQRADHAAELVRSVRSAGGDLALGAWLAKAPPGRLDVESLIALLAPRTRPLVAAAPIVPWAILLLVHE
jgi:hypothetical protein